MLQCFVSITIITERTLFPVRLVVFIVVVVFMVPVSHCYTNLPSPSNVDPPLVGLGSSLAGLELLKVPVADLHVAVVLVHALGELLGSGTTVVAPLLLLSLRGLLVLIGGLGVVLLGSRFGGAAAGEEAADGVADGGANGNTTVCFASLLADGLLQYS